MGLKTKMFLILCIAVCFSCNKEENEKNSPFENFLGTWELEYEVNNGDQNNDVSARIMYIEEDQNQLDSLATGYLEIVDQSTQNQLTLELTNNHKEIIISTESVSLICGYNFINLDQLELDESDDTSSYSSVWKRME